MKKSKFAGLAEAKLRELEGEGQGEENQSERIEEKKARKPAKKSSSKLTHKKASNIAKNKASPQRSIVGVTIKVPEEKRLWWSIQAKLQRTTLTEAIIAALDKRFGEPNF